MTDPSQLSDAELFAIAGIQPRQAAQPAPRPTSSAPRGIRNNNPGNIEDGAFARSLPGYAGSDGRFARFDSPDAGNAAKAQLLGSYIRRGFDTPLEIINRWAPPSDNNPTQAYAAYVAQRVGIRPDQQVTPDQIPLLAQAIAEFENGQTVSQPGPAVQAPADVSQMSDEELLALVGETAPAPRQQTFRGRPVEITVSDPIQTNQAGAFDLTNPTAGMDIRSLGRGDRVALQDGTTRTLTGRPYNDNPRQGEEQIGGFNLRPPNALDATGAYTSGALEQIPFAEEAAVGLSAMLNGQDYSTARDNYMADVARLNESQRGQRVAGGVTGFGLGLAAPGGGWIARGPAAAYRATRAAAVGAGYGGLYGAGAADGGLQERLQGGAVGAGLGAVGGAGFSGAADALGGIAARAQPTAARRLSREGVDLTPGQMLSDVPLLGPVVRGIEDGASSIPIVGAPIAAARERSLSTFNRAALNRALAPIGQQMPRNAEMGYSAIDDVQNRLGAAYDEVLPRVSAQLDQPLYDGLAQVLDRAATEMPEDLVRQLTAVAQQRIFRGLDDASATISGEQFKRIESELGALSREYRNATDPAARAFARSIDDMRGEVRNLIARQNPDEAARIADINRGYANLVRIEDAAGSSASQAAEGVFSPTQLGMAAARGAPRSARARGDALMQDLASAGRAVLPSTVGDSGTATRGALTGIVAGAGAAINPGVAIPTAVATMTGYSQPVQSLVNMLYRAADAPGATAGTLSGLAALARQVPALAPMLERALLQGQLSGELQSRRPSRGTAGLFGARRPQTVPQQ